jgi:hypothetical protein
MQWKNVLASDTTKRCNVCHVEKSLTDFDRRRRGDGWLYNYRCKACQSEYAAEYRRKNVARLQQSKKAYHEAHWMEDQARMAAWRANNADAKRATDRAYRLTNRNRLVAQDRVYHRTLRMEALRAYGGPVPACACCSEWRTEFLGIDHIGGGGAERRKATGSSNFYSWLRQHQYPDGFRVLCHNCNLLFGHYEQCSHRFPDREHWARYLTDREAAREQRVRAVLRSRRRLRLEVWTHYGGDPPQCACCGESRDEFLSIDHVRGGGNAHRRELGSGGAVTYQLLRKQGFPSGYRVLCYNCNLAVGFYGHCPHSGTESTSDTDRA